MDWNNDYEALMRLDGHEPYACSTEGCNHVARGPWGQLIHFGHGAHHLRHRNKHLKGAPK